MKLFRTILWPDSLRLPWYRRQCPYWSIRCVLASVYLSSHNPTFRITSNNGGEALVRMKCPFVGPPHVVTMYKLSRHNGVRVRCKFLKRSSGILRSTTLVSTDTITPRACTLIMAPTHPDWLETCLCQHSLSSTSNSNVFVCTWNVVELSWSVCHNLSESGERMSPTQKVFVHMERRYATP